MHSRSYLRTDKRLLNDRNFISHSFAFGLFTRLRIIPAKRLIFTPGRNIISNNTIVYGVLEYDTYNERINATYEKRGACSLPPLLGYVFIFIFFSTSQRSPCRERIKVTRHNCCNRYIMSNTTQTTPRTDYRCFDRKRIDDDGVTRAGRRLAHPTTNQANDTRA